MKLKRSLLTVMIAVSAFSLIGCSAKKEIPMTEIETGIIKEEILSQKEQRIDAKKWWAFENVKDKIVEGFVSQAMINVKLQDVIVVKTTDTEAIVKAIEEYKEGTSIKLFAGGYGGEENATAAANAILQVKGDYVYFIATPDAAAVEAELLKIIG